MARSNRADSLRALGGSFEGRRWPLRDFTHPSDRGGTQSEDVPMAVEDWGENLRALGASFGGRHWPLSEEQIRVVETKVGWQLPSDYRRYLSETGLSGVQGRRGFVSAAHSTGIHLSVIYGHHPRDHMYSIITLADQFLEPDPLLQIAAGDAGAFYMTEGGAILFGSNWERGLTPLTQSFTEFMDGIEALR